MTPDPPPPLRGRLPTSTPTALLVERYVAGLCGTCGAPGREFCSDCDRLAAECHEERTVHAACPDCPGHGPRHDEGYIACSDHERVPMLPLEGS